MADFVDETVETVAAVQTNGDVPRTEPVAVPTYDELFPPLVSSGDSAHKPVAKWGSSGSSAAASSFSIPLSTVTQVFHVPVDEQRYKQLRDKNSGEKSQAEICREVQSKTNVTIELSLSRSQTLSIVVSGKPDNVLKARKMLLQKLQTQLTLEVAVPKQHHKYILGKGGKKLAELCESTATKILVPKQEEETDIIKIVGTKENAEKARHEIVLIATEQDKLAVERLHIPKMFHTLIAGEGSSRVKQLMTDYGIKIHMPPPSVESDEIVVAGEKDGVAKAAAALLSDYEEKKRTTRQLSVKLAKKQHKYIIGPRGRNLKEILRTTGVDIKMPPLEDPTAEEIIIFGNELKLAMALNLVIEKANSITQDEVSAPKWIHRHIIGKKGANIKQLSEENPDVHIQFSDEKNAIELEGPPAEVAKIKAQLNHTVSELLAKTAYAEIKVDRQFHRHIIGKGGSTIGKIKDETNTNVQIPSDEENSDVITIEGEPAGVEKAKKEILELAKKLADERAVEVKIDQRFHKSIIGAGGHGARDIGDQFGVVLLFPPKVGERGREGRTAAPAAAAAPAPAATATAAAKRGAKDAAAPAAAAAAAAPAAKKEEVVNRADIVTIKGPKDKVEKAKAHLEKLAKELVTLNYTVEVPIFKKFHKHVIGKGGATIRRIKEETNTRISIPADDADSDLVEIVGKKEDVEAARDKINAIQNELADVVNEDISIPSKFHNTIIGRKGRLVRAIMEECGGVQIRFPKEGAKSDKVSIRGPKDDVEKAKQQLLELATEKALNGHTVEIAVPNELHRHIIGRGFATSRKISEETGARLSFPRKNDEDANIVTIIGKEADVKAAQAKVEAIIKDLENIVSDEIHVPAKFHRFFVSNRGHVVREISDEFGGVTISFPKAEAAADKAEIVSLKGGKEFVHKAKARIAELVDEQANRVKLAVVIPNEHHRRFLSNGRTDVRRIEEQLRVLINFPKIKPKVVAEKKEGDDAAIPSEEDVLDTPAKPEDEAEAKQAEDDAAAAAEEAPAVNTIEPSTDKADIVTIVGKKENAEKARDELLGLVPVSVEVHIPLDYHRFIIGAGGKGIRSVMEDYGVGVRFPNAKHQSDVVVIRGLRENVDKARVQLEKRVAELDQDKAEREKRNFKLDIEVDPRHHSHIIGRKGEAVLRLKTEHDVRINFPKKGDDKSPVISLVGYQTSVEACRDEILQMVKDLDSQVTLEVRIDPRLHRRLIGAKGARVREMMDEFGGVQIKFPREENSDRVVIKGARDFAEEARDALVDLAEEFAIEQELEEEERRNQREQRDRERERNTSAGRRNEPGFSVRGAPWTAAPPKVDDAAAFPSMNGADGKSSRAPVWVKPQ